MSITALTTAVTAAAAIIMAISIPISLVCAIALPVLLVVSVIALTVFLFCLKNAYTEINKHSLEKDSLELKSSNLKSKREELKKKFPCISNFLHLEDIFKVAYTKKLFQLEKQTDLDNETNSMFSIFLYTLLKQGCDFGQSKIEGKEENNYISYKYTINNAKEF